MHFLHSSGIVHRDLKSLNLLLDSKWNVKVLPFFSRVSMVPWSWRPARSKLTTCAGVGLQVSDFGLTKFKSDVKRGADNQGNGTVHWTAPEVLNESQDVDHVLADVYSFGIILWELLTREQPHPGMSPAAVAVAVIRNGLRPAIPQDVSEEASEFVELMKTCWHEDPTIRPTFLEIITRLSSSIDKSRSSFTSHTSSR
jgi:serine/threonine protein kinase